MDEGMLKKVQAAAAQIYEERAMQLLKRDREYEELSALMKECEQQYQWIQEILPKENVETLANLWNCRDREAALLNFWTFIVGVEVGRLFSESVVRVIS